MTDKCPLCGTDVLSKGEMWITYGCLTQYRDGELWNQSGTCRLRELPALRERAERAEAACEEWAAAWETARDSILNQRGPMAEMGIDGDQINSVLGVLDDEEPNPNPGQPLLAEVKQLRTLRQAVLVYQADARKFYSTVFGSEQDDLVVRMARSRRAMFAAAEPAKERQ